MKTAVEFIYEEMNKIRLEEESGNIGALEFFNLQHAVFYKAKEKERQQIIDAFEEGVAIGMNGIYAERFSADIYLNSKYPKNDKH